MDVAIVAPCPIPYQRGGAENLWRSLQDHLNEHTPHEAEILKLPSREHAFFELLDNYRAFSEFDVHEFDVVVSGKYPGWMTPHARHVVYMLHPLRGLYETYHYFGLPEAVPDPPADVAALLEFCAQHERDRAALPEFFARIDALRDTLKPELTAFPGPLIRTLTHWLDAIGLHDAQRLGAISHTVAARPGYFPDDADVFVVHPPTERRREPGGRRGDYLLHVGRMDEIKRIDLLIDAVSRTQVPLKIAGTGPEEQKLRELAADNPRITFEGRVSDRALDALYANARAVAFTAYDEDFGLVVLEAMQSARPVIALSDGGGPTELVEDGVTGVIATPDTTALALAIDALWSDRKRWRELGAEGRERAKSVSWDPLVAELEAVAAA